MRPLSKTRVLIFLTHADNGGTQEISRLLKKGLGARGYDVSELFFVRGSDFIQESPDTIICALPPGRGLLHYGRMARLAVTEIRRHKPDVLICLQWGGNLLGGFAAWLAGIRVVIANQFTTPIVPGPVRRIDRLQGSLGLFSRIVVNSETIEKEHADYPQSYRTRLVRIDHGFRDKSSKLSRAEARAIFGLPPGANLLGSVGRLAAEKHFDAAIRLLPGNSGWHLAIAGHGPEADSLRALAASLGCADQLHLIGEVHPDKVGDFLAALDVFVFPSLGETFGLAVVEAAQAGIPVVANDLEVLREVLAVDGKPCALFVDVDNEAVFAQAVSRVLQDESLCGQLTDLGGRLKDRYPLDKMFDDYDRLIKDALSEVKA